ncbi:Bifunctional purine biosynthesis protein PurH [Coemansia thaxteri]|uniref:Bifunctional purine biosynthesis protein PurH n=1 Tax=Coemansia thaxteri TaxID=2663907 RepID=A0A9W8BEF4_9FUNG|nr:Bifunctional purine biosynthesis protein PurH [Coemansia thaxteri]KAJ2006017.1 Bifunctional purine biosynthesis protein PurH [Coemansia thaxteri]KAJ2481403.1 Bifunctional purine biosynthesis protein PurH [Coemansia sp. RSA 2320]
MPESPRFLIANGRVAEASSALQFLRPGCNISGELQDIIASTEVASGDPQRAVEPIINAGFVPDTTIARKVTISDKLETVSAHSASDAYASSFGFMDIVRGRTPDVLWHSLFCTLFLMGFQQWTGAKGIVFYSTEILIKVFGLRPDEVKHTPNSAQWATIGIAGTGIIAVLASMNLIDRCGRRRLLLISTAGMAAADLMIVVGRVYHISALAVMAMFAFKISYGLGMAPIPWLAASEMLPYYALGTMSGIASALNWTMVFTIGLVFPVLARALQNYLFVPFACLNMVGFAVVLLAIPETKGRSISDILFHHGKRVHIVCTLASRKQETAEAPMPARGNSALAS